MSQRDLGLNSAKEYAALYNECGANVVSDPQLYFNEFSNAELRTYPTEQFRATVSTQRKISEKELGKLRTALVSINAELNTSAVIAPAVVYEAGQAETAILNAKLFRAAKKAGESAGKPTYATAVMGRWR